MSDRGALRKFLVDRADAHLVSLSVEAEAVDRYGVTWAEADEAALEAGLLPARYRRNRETVSVAQQLRLLHSVVVVIGCGGLGGYVLEELARLGVGRITAVDPDSFEEHNLNRQILSSPAAVGRGKANAAADRIAAINPAVHVCARPVAFSRANAVALLDGAEAVVDALDAGATRVELAEACSALGVPLVHGAIAGWYGQVATIFPGDRTLHAIYSRAGDGDGLERGLGNPAFTPAVIASIQAAEVCKILLGVGALLRGRVLSIDLLEMRMETVPLD